VDRPLTGDEPTRRRLIATLFGASALSSTAFIAVATVAPIVGATLTGSPTLAGIPSTAGTLGAAFGAVILGWAGSRLGRRRSFTIGWTIAALGSGLAALALEGEGFLLFSAGLFVIGFGRSVRELARYAAGDLREESRRGAAISLIVWAATIGAVVGPLLIGPAGDWARSIGQSELVGPLFLAMAIFGLTALSVVVLLRPDPLALAVADDEAVDLDELAHPHDVSLATMIRRPNVALALVAFAVAQGVMVLVMTMTPVHIRAAGDDLSTVGWVMMAHTLGMFAIAPVTGWLVDRTGSRRMILLGAAVLAASCLGAAAATEAQFPILVLALFGLGVGWNFAYVAASTLLQEGLTIAERVRLQGVGDAVTWSSAAAGAALSGVVVGAFSYPVLGLGGAVITAVLFAGYVRWGRGTRVTA
jgi:MFS family permease